MCEISSWVVLFHIKNKTIKFLLFLFSLSHSSLVYTPFTNSVNPHLQYRTCCHLNPIINYSKLPEYWCNWLLYILTCVLPSKRENSSMNHGTRCMMGTLPPRGTSSQSQKLKRCGGFFLMSLVLLWRFLWIGKKLLLHWCYWKKDKKSEKEKFKDTKFFSYVPVSTMSSFNLIKEFKLVKKNDEKNKKWFQCLFSK